MSKETTTGGKRAASNKTAHVLNLLTDRSAEAAENGAPIAHPKTNDITSDLAAQGNIAEQVKGALEEELMGELAAAQPVTPPVIEAPAPVAEPVAAPVVEAPTPVAEPVAAPVVEAPTPVAEPVVAPVVEAPTPVAEPVVAPVVEAPTPVAEPVVAPVVEAPTPVAEPVVAASVAASVPFSSGATPNQNGAAASDYISYVNVMQELVEKKVDKYMDLLGVCNCPRCKVDVIALTLGNLPAKYVVVTIPSITPMLTFYENKFGDLVMSQILASCKKVMDRPNHNSR